MHVPLFTAFGPDAVAYRVRHSGAQTVITDMPNRGKFACLDGSAVHFLCLPGQDASQQRGDRDLAAAIEHGPAAPAIRRAGDDLMILLYTSGTTGQPKGVEVPIRALAGFRRTCTTASALCQGCAWNIADPGGPTASTRVVGELLLGQTILWRAASSIQQTCTRPFSGTELATSPAPRPYTARMRAAGVPAGFRETHRLRAISSGGEPLNAELLEWSRRELGVPSTTTTARASLAWLHSSPSTLGCESSPSPARWAAPRPAAADRPGRRRPRSPSWVPGKLAVDVESPAFWFRGYASDPERTAERFRHGEHYYLTGDSVRQEETGLLFFASRHR